MNDALVDIKSGKETIYSCVIKELTVAMDARRMILTKEILERDCDENIKMQLMTCAAFAASFHNKEGELIYPDKPEVEGYSVADDIFENMSAALYDKLCSAYVEVNPLKSSLETKKKKF